uniref:Putative cyclin-dependent kinase 2-associated protein n=1 Tax=Amblyomma americanum TaxID=6943 RepID=A0A0C9RRE1_AMBAM
MDEDSRSTDSPGQSQPGTPLQTSHSPGAVNMGLVPGDGARHPQGCKSSAERLKRGIVHARILVRECLMETERNARS